MSQTIHRPVFCLGPWQVNLAAGTLSKGENQLERIEPRVADLLGVLVDAKGEVVTRDVLFAALWPDTTVGEDTLSRTVFKLRKALGDDPKNPQYIETVPKRGYRLLKAVQPAKKPYGRRLLAIGATAALLLIIAAFGVSSLLDGDADGANARAVDDIDLAMDRYMRFTRADNEAAIELYNRVLNGPAPDPMAQTGLAAALVQRVIRWPKAIGLDVEGASTVAEALEKGIVDQPKAKDVLQRARHLAEQSARRDPSQADTWRIVGLVRTAERDFDGALAAYQTALMEEPNNWEVQVNLAELHDLLGNPDQSYNSLSSAYEAMKDAYTDEPHYVGRWHAGAGLLVAEKDRAAGRLFEAESWYRRILQDYPFHPETTSRLAELLNRTGRRDEGQRICLQFEARTGDSISCTE